ncbi:MAG TPA: tetratricopeptide repeat protein, partial [Saprospiraceae bacterium]|nr:tetratricopeptide repeat protein [Saprospiraceae bacterium]
GVFFFLGLMSKENTITFLAVIPLSIYFFRGRNLKPSLRSIVGPLLATLVFLGIRFSILGSSFGEAPLELMNNPFLKWTGDSYVSMGFLEKWPMILYSLGMYLWLFIVPHPLSHDYYPLEIPPTSFSDPVVLLSLLAYIFLVTGVIYFWKRKSWLSFGLLIFLACLSIVSNVVFPVGTNMSERFLFMPSVGLSIVAGGAIMQLRNKGALIITLIVLITTLFSIKTISRNAVWKDNFTLFTTDVNTSENSAKLQNAAAGALIDHSVKLEEAEKTSALLRAIDHLKKAKEIHPTYKSPNLLLGNAHFYLEQYEKAIGFYKKALAQDPGFADASLNLALSHRALNNFDECIALLEAMDGEPRVAQKAKAQLLLSYEEAGKAMGQKGQLNKGFDYFQTGLKRGGDPAKFNYFLGITSAQLGNLVEAKQYLEEAKTHPMDLDNQQNVETALARVISDLKKAEGNE